MGCYNGEESPAEPSTSRVLCSLGFRAKPLTASSESEPHHLPHRCPAVTDLFAPHREAVSGALNGWLGMGNDHHIDTYAPPGGVNREDRLSNVLVVGRPLLATAMLQTFAIEDILDGKSVVWIATDSSARTLLRYIPGDRVNDVIFFSPGSREDRRRPTAWNLLKDTPPDKRYDVAEGITAAFGSVYKEFWGPQSAMLLRSAAQAILDLGGSTLLGCLEMLSNDAYRQQVRRRIKDQGVRGWWDAFERWPHQQKQGAIAPLQNKLGTLRSSWPMRNILCQMRNKLEVDDVFRGQMLIVELKRAHLGSREAVRLFGSLLLHDLMRAGFQRGVRGAPECFVYLNNAAAFAPDVIEEFVVGDESPFTVGLATAYLDRLEPTLELALLSACGTMIASRSSYADAQTFFKHFGQLRMKEREFADLGWNDLAVKPWVGRPFWSTFTRFPQEQFAEYGKAPAIIARSLDRYGTPRAKVERKLSAWRRHLADASPSLAPRRGKR